MGFGVAWGLTRGFWVVFEGCGGIYFWWLQSAGGDVGWQFAAAFVVGKGPAMEAGGNFRDPSAALRMTEFGLGETETRTEADSRRE